MTLPKRSLDASLSYLVLFKIRVVDSVLQPAQPDFSPARFSSIEVAVANLRSFVSKTSFDSSTGNLLLGLGGLLFYVWLYSFVLTNLWANRKLNTQS